MNHTVPHPASPASPKYWQSEPGSRFAGPMLRYMRREELTLRDVALIRVYLQQWVDAPAWEKDVTTERAIELVKLRAKVCGARTKDQIDSCIEMATKMGMDPL